MSCCCGKKQARFYTREGDFCGFEEGPAAPNMGGLSCPFDNNNDCMCGFSLKDAAADLTNQRVVIHVDGCKMCVIIVGIGEHFIKTVNPHTHRIVYFNLSRINNIENVLPRCY